MRSSRRSTLSRALRAVHHAVFLASREGRAAEIAAWSNGAAAVAVAAAVVAFGAGGGGGPRLAHASWLAPGAVFYDIVTHPLETPLRAEAKARGFRTIDGLSMLIGQAAIAFELFFGAPPPREPGDPELRVLLTK